HTRRRGRAVAGRAPRPVPDAPPGGRGGGRRAPRPGAREARRAGGHQGAAFAPWSRADQRGPARGPTRRDPRAGPSAPQGEEARALRVRGRGQAMSEFGAGRLTSEGKEALRRTVRALREQLLVAIHEATERQYR